MSAAQSEAALERLAAIREGMGAEDFAAHAFLTLGMLGWHAPEVPTFLLDQAEQKITT